MDRVRAYIAGAYSSDNAIGVFDNMRRGIRLSFCALKAGFAPFVPWFDYQFALIDKMELKEFYEYSMAWLEASDCVIVVEEGWEKSKGTVAEIERAKDLGIPVFFNLKEATSWMKQQTSE